MKLEYKKKPIADLNYPCAAWSSVDLLHNQSEDAEVVNEDMIETTNYLSAPISRATLQDKFESLAATWKFDNAVESSISKMTLDPSYLEIIGMGSAAIPALLQELINKPDHWFQALTSITGENPIKPENRGNIQAMVEDWLSWGKHNGYLA